MPSSSTLLCCGEGGGRLRLPPRFPVCHCDGGGTGLVGHCTEGSELIDSVLDVVLRRVDFAEVFAVHVAVECLWRWVAALDLHHVSH